MILKNTLDLSKSIDAYRKDMYELAKNKGISDPDVIKISHQLEEKITMLQKIISEISSLPTRTSLYQTYKHS